MNDKEANELDILLEKALTLMREYIDLRCNLLEKKLKDLEKDFTFHKHN